MVNPYNYYKNWRPFTEPEAWTLFKIAAIAEAIGWLLLIIAIIVRDNILSGNGVPVTVAGRIHGMMFVAYIVAVLALSPSLGWHWFRTIVAGLFSMPPFGSLVYEVWSSRRRQRRNAKNFIARTIISE